MTDSVDTAGKDDLKKASAPTLSPEALLKQAVSGSATSAETPASRIPAFKPNPLMLGALAGALALGGVLGLVAAPQGGSDEALRQMAAGLEAGRLESARLNVEVERLTKAVAGLKDQGEAARGDRKSVTGVLGERIGKMEQVLDKHIAALSERLEQAEREQAARQASLTALIEKRLAAAPVAASPAPAPTAKADPVQTTGSLPDKPKPEAIESWAVREVYDGVAMLEDRKRRLVEVAPGDSVPGIGRVEAIERRGRNWVVVTKQGLITTQSW
ncbi:hypothetical protein MMB17_08825 [Methylobacterium organophilum]|uniref:hypothetical protein n=1 Tax=Methylobacterium organophilum TaxID=410 RepID=UPI001F138E8C|nr:hypothetical protein [Methylobacterium organophilum]UMY19382.1 hypothetical protein MMB17_08825 [Methylobacterium organophilum]